MMWNAVRLRCRRNAAWTWRPEGQASKALGGGGTGRARAPQCPPLPSPKLEGSEGKLAGWQARHLSLQAVCTSGRPAPFQVVYSDALLQLKISTQYKSYLSVDPEDI